MTQIKIVSETEVAHVRQRRILDLLVQLNKALEENNEGYDILVDELDELIKKQSDEEHRGTLQIVEAKVVRGEEHLDVIALLDYARTKAVRAHREAYAFLGEKCPGKLSGETFLCYNYIDHCWNWKERLSSGIVDPRAAEKMLKLLLKFNDPRAGEIARMLAPFAKPD